MKILTLISRQDALLILRSSLGSPKLLHTLRCSPCTNHPTLAVYDSLVQKGLELILNIVITESQWAQVALPIKMGGLGIRRVSWLGLPAFLASVAGTLPLQCAVLHFDGNARPHKCAMRSHANPVAATNRGHQSLQFSQWDKSLLKEMALELSNSPIDSYDQRLSRHHRLAACNTLY